MPTTTRWRALRWFADHDRDVNAVMGRRMPSTRMHTMMIREGQLLREPVGSFEHYRFKLTEAGHELLRSKYKRNRGD
jgi:hypothetical protein